MMKEKLSILIPVYKVENYIEKCAASLFGQTYENLQFIFVDDCSPDRSIEILNKTLRNYPARAKQTRIIRHEHNQGLSAARNTAVAATEGEYLMHMDSDDYLSVSTAVSELMSVIVAEQADAVIFDMQHVFRSKTVFEKQSIPGDPKEYVRRIIRRECSVCVCGGIYCTSLYKDHGIISIEGIQMGEDYAVKPRLLFHAGKIVHVEKPFYCYTHLNDSAYTGCFRERYIDDMCECLVVLTDFFSIQPDNREFLDDIAFAHTRIKAELLLSWGMYKGTRRALRRIRKLHEPVGKCDAQIPLHYKFMLLLCSCRMPFLLRWYANLGIRIKNALKS